jgi:hypothetical protein
METRRFPPPWSVEDIGAAFVVTDSAGQKLAYVYFEEEKLVRVDLCQKHSSAAALDFSTG